MQPMLTIREVAALLQVSTMTCRRLWAAGQLPPPLKLGRSIRWRREDVTTWLRAQSSGVADEKITTQKAEAIP